MNNKVTIATNMKALFKEMEAAFYDKKILDSGTKYPNLNFSARELIPLIILAALHNELDSEDDLFISSDPEDMDGILTDLKKINPKNFAVESVYIRNESNLNLTEKIIQEILKKESKGKVYGDKRNLVVFVNKVGKIERTKLEKHFVQFLNFDSYRIIYLESCTKDVFTYIMINFKSKFKDEDISKIIINPKDGSYNCEHLGMVK